MRLRALGASAWDGYARLRPLARAVVFASVLVIAFTLWVSAMDCAEFAGVDLRPKIVGARAMLARLNPYNYEWVPGMSDTLLDPLRVHPGYTHATYAPPLFLMYLPLATLRYPTQRVFWFLAEWAAMAGLVFLWSRSYRGTLVRVVFLAITSFLIIAAWNWRLHVERGQYYVFLDLLITLAVGPMIRRTDTPWHGVPIGIAMAFRPTLVCLAVVTFFSGRRRLAIVAGATAATLCAVTLPFIGLAGWRTYFALMHAKSAFDGGASLQTGFGPTIEVPRFYEGVDGYLGLPHYSENYSLFALAMGSPFLERHYATLSKALGMAVTVIGCLGAIIAERRYRSPRLVAAVAMVTLLVFDFVITPERNTYVEIMLLLPIAVMLPLLLRIPRLHVWFAIAIVGLFFGQGLLGTVDPYFAPGLRWRFPMVVGSMACACIAMLAWRRQGRTS